MYITSAPCAPFWPNDQLFVWLAGAAVHRGGGQDHQPHHWAQQQAGQAHLPATSQQQRHRTQDPGTHTLHRCYNPIRGPASYVKNIVLYSFDLISLPKAFLPTILYERLSDTSLLKKTFFVIKPELWKVNLHSFLADLDLAVFSQYGSGFSFTNMHCDL